MASAEAAAEAMLQGEGAAAGDAAAAHQEAEVKRIMSEWDPIIEQLIGEMYLVPDTLPYTEGVNGESGAYYYDEELQQYLITDDGFNTIMAAVDTMEHISADAPTVLGAIPNEVVIVVKQQLKELGLVEGGYGPPSLGDGSDGEGSGEGWRSDTA
jgi:hypothetical protein